jgi:hypothetical protein
VKVASVVLSGATGGRAALRAVLRLSYRSFSGGERARLLIIEGTARPTDNGTIIEGATARLGR